MSRDQSIEQALDYYLNAEFKVHDFLLFHETENNLFVTIANAKTSVYQFSGFFSIIVKLIFLRAARGVKGIDRVIDLFDPESKLILSAHQDDLEEYVVQLYTFLVANEFLTNNAMKASLPTIKPAQENNVYRIGSLEARINLVTTHGDNFFELNDEQLGIYASGTMSACTSY